LEQCLGVKPLLKSFSTQNSEITQAGVSLPVASGGWLSQVTLIANPTEKEPGGPNLFSVGEAVPIMLQYEACLPQNSSPACHQTLFLRFRLSSCDCHHLPHFSPRSERHPWYVFCFHWLWLSAYLEKLFPLKARGISKKLKKNKTKPTSNQTITTKKSRSVWIPAAI